jgi:transcriptional regulator with XRE-family HTH domain
MARKRDGSLLATSERVQAGFGSRLQQARIARKLSQSQLADILHITRTSVSNIERGRHRVFLDQAYLAARHLGIRVPDLLPELEDVFVRQDAPHLAGSVPTSVSAEVSEVAQSVSRGFAASRSERSTRRTVKR